MHVSNTLFRSLLKKLPTCLSNSESIKNSAAKEECELTGVPARAVTLHALSGNAATAHAGWQL